MGGADGIVSGNDEDRIATSFANNTIILGISLQTKHNIDVTVLTRESIKILHVKVAGLPQSLIIWVENKPTIVPAVKYLSWFPTLFWHIPINRNTFSDRICLCRFGVYEPYLDGIGSRNQRQQGNCGDDKDV